MRVSIGVNWRDFPGISVFSKLISSKFYFSAVEIACNRVFAAVMLLKLSQLYTSLYTFYAIGMHRFERPWALVSLVNFMLND